MRNIGRNCYSYTFLYAHWVIHLFYLFWNEVKKYKCDKTDVVLMQTTIVG